MILLLIWALMRFWDMSVVHNKKQQRQQITTNRECDTLQEENFCCGCCDNIDEVNSGCNECNCHNRKGSDDNYLSHYFKGKRFASLPITEDQRFDWFKEEGEGNFVLHLPPSVFSVGLRPSSIGRSPHQSVHSNSHMWLNAMHWENNEDWSL